MTHLFGTPDHGALLMDNLTNDVEQTRAGTPPAGGRAAEGSAA